MGFWLDRLINYSKIPYPVFFGLIVLLLYLLGIPFMILTGNLQSFIAKPKWILVTTFGAVSGISVIFAYRKLSDSLTEINHLFSFEDEFQKTKDKILG
jgi:hypothetical protein